LGAKQFSTDAFISYSRMLFKGKVRWETHLNLRNLLNEDPLLARVAVDDGTGAGQVTLRGMQDRFSAQLSNTFKF
jgi:hypothetical protein